MSVMDAASPITYSAAFVRLCHNSKSFDHRNKETRKHYACATPTGLRGQLAMRSMLLSSGMPNQPNSIHLAANDAARVAMCRTQKRRHAGCRLPLRCGVDRSERGGCSIRWYWRGRPSGLRIGSRINLPMKSPELAPGSRDTSESAMNNRLSSFRGLRSSVDVTSLAA